MTHIHRWSQKPSGQVLLATLLFCFIFITLFVGLFKSGLLFSAKERAIQAANMTALSAGAVYANGMQVVRLSNAIVFAIAIGTVALLATGVGSLLEVGAFLTGKNPIKLAQDVQKLLFGIDEPTGLYPILIFTETLSITSQNGLKNTWPNVFDPSTWKLPTSIPSPIMLFNVISIGPESIKSLNPNMALKLRDGSTLFKIPKLYKLVRDSDGKVFIYTQNQVEYNEGLKHYRVKRGLENQYKTVSEIGLKGTDQANKVIQTLNSLSGMHLDVIDRDDPPLHNIFFYASYPTTASDQNGKNAEIQTLSQVTVSGSGLEFWKVSDPPYVATLSSTDPIELIKQSGFMAFIQNLLQSGKIPSLQDLFGKAPGGII